MHMCPCTLHTLWKTLCKHLFHATSNLSTVKPQSICVDPALISSFLAAYRDSTSIDFFFLLAAQLCRTCTEPQSSVQDNLFPIFFHFSCSNSRLVWFLQAAAVLTLQWGCLKCAKRTWKVYFKRPSPGLRSAQIMSVKWTIHKNVFAKIKYGNADFCRQSINLYFTSASAAQHFFLHNLSLLWLLFAFLWYIAVCPRPAHLTHCAGEQTILYGEESHMSPWNRKQEISNNKELTQLQLDCLQPRGNVKKTWNHESLKEKKKVLFFLVLVVRGGLCGKWDRTSLVFFLKIRT